MKFVFAIFFSLIFSLNYCIAQDDEIIVLSAKQNFESGNYVKALEQYLDDLDNKPGDIKLNYKIGACYVKLNIDKSKAIPYLEKAVNSGKADKKALYELARAYHLTNRLTDAIKYYNLFLPYTKDSRIKALVNRQIEMVNNAKVIMKFPLNVTFENLGNKINSKDADFSPFVPKNEAFLVFATKRYGVTGSFVDFDGYYTTDVYLSKLKNGNFYKPRSISGGVNSELVEVPVGISVDGKRIFYNADNYNATGDVWYTELGSRGRSFSNGKPLKGGVNFEDTYESGATQSADGNTLIFGSERKGGFGGTDLYYSKKLPTGDWGKAINLGPHINTRYDDLNPQLSFDETILYFVSEGHTSIGGFDIFKAEWDAENIATTNIQNMGYPINTTDDQMSYCPTGTDRYGYISALRPKGLGDLDLYRVEFNEEDPQYTVVRANLIDYDTTKTFATSVFITATNSETEEVAGTYDISNAKKGRFIMALPPGNYELMIEPDGYKMKLEKISIPGKSRYKTIIEKDFYIEKKAPKTESVPAKETKLTTIAVETKKVPKNTTNSFVKTYPKNKVIYKVQIEKTNPTLSNSFIHKLKQLGVSKEIVSGNKVIFTKGNFINSYDAIKLAKALKSKGFKIAFPIAILNGAKIPLQKGIEFQKAKAQKK